MTYVGLDRHACSSEVFLMGNARFVVMVCNSHFLSSRKNV